MSTSFESDECARARRNPLVLGVHLALFVGLIAGKIALGRPFWDIALWAGFMGPYVMVSIYSANFKPWLQPVRVRADAGGVSIGARFVPRTIIERGTALPGDVPTVELRLRGARLPLQLRMGSARDVRALLEVLGLDGRQTVAEFRAQAGLLVDLRLMWVPLGVTLAAMVLSLVLDAGALDWPMFTLLMMPMNLIQRPTWVGVGGDGIVLAWLWRRRFIAFDGIVSIERCEKSSAGLRIVQASGEETVLQLAGDELARVQARAEEAFAAFREGRPGPGGPFRASAATAAPALLGRRDRSFAEWARDLRALGAQEGTSAVPKERLFRIVESPAAEAADRVAAAVALAGGSLDPEARTRLRAAAATVAAPKLRVALEKATRDEGDAAIEAALAEVCAEEPKRLRAKGPTA